MSVSTTTNYGLKKPSDDDFYDVSRYRDNMDAVDAQMKANADAAASALNAAQNVDISGKADKATTLSGYGITDSYTKTESDNLLNKKANSATTLAGYGISDSYTKIEVDSLVNNVCGVIVSSSAPSKTNVLWIDTGNGGIAKYYDATAAAWTTVKAVWG